MQAKKNDEFLVKNTQINKYLDDLELTLKSLNYTKKEIKKILAIIIKEPVLFTKNEKDISFENLLKLAMNYLDNDNSKLAL